LTLVLKKFVLKTFVLKTFVLKTFVLKTFVLKTFFQGLLFVRTFVPNIYILVLRQVLNLEFY
jgi:hypothetical protein